MPAAPAPAPAPTPTPPPAAAQTPPAQDPPSPEAQAVEKASAAVRDMLDKRSAQRAEAGKPSTPAQPDETEEMEKVVKSNPKAWRVYEGVKKKWHSERDQLNAKIAALEAKPNPTATDDAKVRQMEQRIAEIEAEAKTAKQKLTEYDYRNSEEFQQKYVQQFQKVYQRGAEFTKGLQVLNDLGEPDRAATQQDFDALRSLPLQQRRKAAKDMFGDAAFDVLQFITKLDEIRSEADEAIQSHSQNYEKTRAERQAAEQAEAKAFEGFKSSIHRDLESKYPELFSPGHYKDNPEMQQSLVDGYRFVDDVTSNASKMSKEDLASNTAVVRAYAAAFPAMHLRNEQLKAEVEKLKAELAGKAASDPGAARVVTGGTPPKVEAGGIDAIASKFDE